MTSDIKIHKPKRTSLSSQVVQEIERQIRENVWQLGERIPAEPELAAAFGVSRNTVREALQSLIHAGILAARPGDGTYVQRRSRMESALHSELSLQNIDKVLEARLTLEPGIVALAAANRTADDLKKIRAALDERNKSDNPQLDAAFHMNVAYAAHNPLLENFYNEICRYMLQNLPEKPLEGRAYTEETALHETLYRALNDQNAELAQTTAQAIVNIYASRF
jgi:DNA-binding FadR family transcriptional regulator